MPVNLCGRLIIKVKDASGLADCDSWGGVSDPYCVLKLDEEEMGRTTVCNDQSSPIWNEGNSMLHDILTFISCIWDN